MTNTPEHPDATTCPTCGAQYGRPNAGFAVECWDSQPIDNEEGYQIGEEGFFACHRCGQTWCTDGETVGLGRQNAYTILGPFREDNRDAQ